MDVRRRLRAPFRVSGIFANRAEPRRQMSVFAAQEDRAMQTGFIEITMIAALMLSSLVWIQPF